MNWSSPNAFFLLLGMPFIIILYFFQKKNSIPFPWITIFTTEYTSKENTLLAHLPLILKIFSLFFLSLAIARPQKIDEANSIFSKGIDIMLCLDISDSMRADDIKPNRLSVAQKVVSNFISARKNDRIGLVIYGSESFIQCPLTLDHRTVQDFLSKIDFSPEIGKQTAIGLAISSALNALKNSTSESKIIILLTDGVNNISEISPEVAAQIAAQLNIKIYTIGLGIPGENQIRTMKNNSNLVSVNEFINTLDETPLKDISKLTGGLYFNAQGEKYLEKVYQTIDELEKTEFQQDDLLSWKEYFIWPLVISFFSFLYGFYLEKRFVGF